MSILNNNKRLLDLMMKNRRVRRFLCSVNTGQSVIIVGNNPSLINRKLGPLIDEFDVVIRVNLSDQQSCPADFGKRCDIRFIGATLEEVHLDSVLKICLNSPIITPLKNRAFLERHGVLDVLYISNSTPNDTLGHLSRLCPSYQPDWSDSRPPRSGLVLCQLILSWANAKRVTLVGFTTSSADAEWTLDFEKMKAKQCDSSLRKKNHCEFAEEIRVLSALEAENMVDVIK